MSASFNRLRFLLSAVLLFSAAQRPSLAGSATWSGNPTNGDWNTAANWVPNTVPNAPSDIATFGASNVTAVSITNTNIDLDSAVFNSGAPPYTVTVQNYSLTLSGAGITNNSGVMQSFVVSNNPVSFGIVSFSNTASAGEMTSFSSIGGGISFSDSASAGSATFNLTEEGMVGINTYMDFGEGTTAADATINVCAGAYIIVSEASGGNATFNVSAGSYLQFGGFGGNTSVDHAIVNCIGGGGDLFGGSSVLVVGAASAGEGIFTTIGGSTSGEQGGFIYFGDSATADNASFVINGGMGAGLTGTALIFTDTSIAANANITANGGVDGSHGGGIFFRRSSQGGEASITLNGNGKLNLDYHKGPVTIGSLSGDGLVVLAGNRLTIGSNNQSTTFSGVIQDGGGVTKSGTGTLILTGNNLYTGGTIETAGVLDVSNRRGSGTGTGTVQVNTGTLGGKGIISGAVTIGTGSGSGAFLAPAARTNVQAMLTIQSGLTFNADATYAYTFRAKRNRAGTDEVFASGVIINSGAMIALSGQTQGRLATGLTLTLISNTSANPISGTFSNLPDGGIVTINGNNFQASYEGGDGNDLTLTVVP